MIEFEWEKQAPRADVAALLRQLADGLEAGGEVELEQDGWELKVAVPDVVDVEVEVESDGGEAELSIELSWPTSRPEAPEPAEKAEPAS